ncbi:hypothetical protein [Haloprofundus salinisoli]|uniref:hypothetical protein n=1 Tax=Haloprofundus salinisoli TaxID=2876193 RepID=UPI001CCD8111|nr:hypothetical protein [Haloprofundus salinisoli]
MGIFNELGRQAEQFKRTVQTTAEENAAYRCRECDARFHTHLDQCPECKSTRVGPATTEE